MNLKQIYLNNHKTKYKISFEVFPPKENFEEKSNSIIEELITLKKFNPQLVSITYGAGGSNKANSLDLVKKIKEQTNLNVMPHLTCKNSSSKFIQDYLEEIKTFDIKNVLALRGDVPLGEEESCFDFKHASDLVKFIKQKTEISIGVAGYPEGHTEAKSIDFDIENLKKKVDCGADAIFTQLFFDNEHFYKYVDKLKQNGITATIIPGILPIISYAQVSRMTKLCGVKLPEELHNNLEKNKENPSTIKEIGLEFAIKQVAKLQGFGTECFHFYILNKAEPTKQILEANFS